MRIKYPRTFHLPFSEGISSDDKVLHDLSSFENKEIVITEKMDGENTSMYADYIHARSIDTRDHPSRHWVKGLWASIRHEIPQQWRICGENLYALHSIPYTNLESYFYVFSIWNEENCCLSWDETKEYCTLLGLSHVPEVYRGAFDIEIIKKRIAHLDLQKQEGIVIRLSEKFEYEDFSKSVLKWVRKNHVTTDQHWIHHKVIPNHLNI